MGKATGFMEYERKNAQSIIPLERIKNFDEFHIPLSEEEQKLQGARCMDCGVPFCQSGVTLFGMTSGCPLHNLIPEWNDFVYTGNLQQAYKRLKKTNNFPEFTGRVCPALCEAACTCGMIPNTMPVSTKENELAIIENAYVKGYAAANPPKIRTGKKVAVIGSGPAGLAAADELNRRGHEVTVYERSDRIGGLLMYGIPNMKLDKKIIFRKLKVMEEEGINFITGSDIKSQSDAQKLMKQYDSVVLACGASAPRDIKCTGRDAKGVFFAVDFLKLTTKSLLDSEMTDGRYISAHGKNVVIIGGGDTGNDCVGTCIRHGAKSVTQLEMTAEPPQKRTEENAWPQWPKIKKTDYGQEEAIALYGMDPRRYQTTVKAFIKDSEGELSAVQTVLLTWKLNPDSRRMESTEVEGSEKTLPAEMAIIAAGFLGSQSYVSEAFGVKLDMRNNVYTERGQYATNVEHVFTAGDMHRGQSLVVWAIYEGRNAAHEVDRHLMGYTNI